MKCPIDVELYIADMGKIFGDRPNYEGGSPFIAALVDAYQDGLDGAPGHPRSPGLLVGEFEKHSGAKAIEREPLEKIVLWLNEAYEEGRKAATI